MTTPPTPADWYPDPEDPTGLRYWDGAGWTEHRAPGPVADTPADTQQQPAQPYDTHIPTSYDSATKDDEVPWNPPLPPWDSPAPEQPSTPEPTQSFVAPPRQPPTEPSAYEPHQGAPHQAPYQPVQFTSPPGPPPPNGTNIKLIAGILGGAAAILLAIIVVIVVVVMRKDDATVTSAQNTSSTSATSSTSSSETTSSEQADTSTSAAPTTPPPSDATAADGDYTFSIAGTEAGDTITSTVSDSVQTTADGTFYVVYVNVTNTGTAPVTFVGTFQQLNAAGQQLPLDDEATAFLGGTVAEIAPGAQVETPLVYDVPVGTVADSILLRADPSTPGAELPLR